MRMARSFANDRASSRGILECWFEFLLCGGKRRAGDGPTNHNITYVIQLSKADVFHDFRAVDDVVTAAIFIGCSGRIAQLVRAHGSHP